MMLFGRRIALSRIVLQSHRAPVVAGELYSIKLYSDNNPKSNDANHATVAETQQTGAKSLPNDSRLSTFTLQNRQNPVKLEACGDDLVDDNDDLEQEEMFVEPHESFGVRGREWGGPRRGGRFPEPTRYNDWERKGRCSDF